MEHLAGAALWDYSYRYSSPTHDYENIAEYPCHGGYNPPSHPFGTSGSPLHPEGCRTAERSGQLSLINLSIDNFKSPPVDRQKRITWIQKEMTD